MTKTSKGKYLPIDYNMIEYRSINEELKKEYGQKVYKVSINAGFTCPNRDGKLSSSGCIFCSEGGSGDFAEDSRLSITEQIEHGKLRIQKKAPKCSKFIAYFQAFTNTYAPVEKLEHFFMEAINHPDVVILSIATRSDCLEDEKIELLKRLNQIKPVWVELGLQSIHESTARFINRGYELSVYDDAMRRLSDAGIKVITHVILGLPNETPEDCLATVKYVAQSGSWGIKLQLLHILKNTPLAAYYEKNPFHIFTLEEYCELVAKCLAIIPDTMVVHRITGDGPKKLLIEPQWSANKKLVLNTLHTYVSAMR